MVGKKVVKKAPVKKAVKKAAPVKIPAKKIPAKSTSCIPTATSSAYQESIAHAKEVTTPTKPRDLRVTIVLILSCISVIIMGIGTPIVLSQSTTTGQLRDSSAVQGCRSQANAKVTDANTKLTDIRVQNDILQDDLFAAAIDKDVAGITNVKERLPLLLTALIDANAEVKKANYDFQTAVKLSNDDPKKFLKMCQ